MEKKNSQKKIIISDSKNKFVQVGENTYKNNPTMRLISDVMSDPTFRDLFDTTLVHGLKHKLF